MVHVTQFRLCFYERLDSLDGALDGSRELIDILWLDDSLEVIFEDFGEIVYFELVGYFWT
jgi:hypothetical protein